MTPDLNATNTLIEMVKKGQLMGQLRKGDPVALAFLFSNTLNAIAIGHEAFHDVALPEPEWVLDLLKKH